MGGKECAAAQPGIVVDVFDECLGDGHAVVGDRQFHAFETALDAGLDLAGAARTRGLAGVGLGIGTIFGNLLVACARQPNMTRMLFNYAILGFALTEAIGLFALMLAFLMLFS